jgi:iron complex transport system substrate-binding protein
VKKLLALALSAMIVPSLAACASDAPTSVTITTLNGLGREIKLEVPYNPKRIAVMDLGALDILDNLGLGDRVAGVSKGSSIEYLQSYITNDAILNLGNIKEADLEAVMECDPEVIFIGGRLSPIYDELIRIAPVVYLAADRGLGVVKSTGRNAMTVASMFGVEDKVSGLMAKYDARIAALSDFAEGRTAVVGMVNAGGFGVLGNDGRCSVIGVEVGFKNIGMTAAASGRERGAATSVHGNEASFEILVSLNPDYIFVMDRDAAIGTGGAQLARDVMENELVRMTSAYQSGNIVYLEHSNVWYTAEGGITALGIMLSDLETALLPNRSK